MKKKEYFKKENSAMKKLSKEELDEIHIIYIQYRLLTHLKQELEEHGIDEKKIPSIIFWFSELESYTIYKEIEGYIKAEQKDKWRHLSPRSYNLYQQIKLLNKKHKELNRGEFEYLAGYKELGRGK